MTKPILNTILAIIAIALLYIAGPKPNKAIYSQSWPNVPSTADSLEHFIAQKESKYKLRPNNEARIVWFDSTRSQTEYVVLYLHGFSASQGEGDPVHQKFAKSIGANLYLTRLQGHGQDTVPQLATFTAEGGYKDALEALSIAQKLGKKVIIMSTSTGGTFAIKLAAEFPNKVHTLINLSPNLALATPAGRLLNNHWGKQIATLVFGGSERYVEQKNGAGEYWDSLYTVNALVQLEELIETTMLPETFKKVKCPALTLYYYKNDVNRDSVVDIFKIPEAHELFATPANQKQFVALASPQNHVLASPYKSKDVEIVYKTITDWWDEMNNNN